MSGKTTILRCGKCQTLNRVQLEKLADRPKCGSCSSVITIPRSPMDATKDSFQNEVLRWPGSVLVVFWGPWCSHCRALFPVLDRIAAEKAGLLKIVKINVHSEQTLAAQFNILGVPSLFLYRNGARLRDISGALSYVQLLQWLGPL